MTETEQNHCPHCGGPVPAPSGRGRPRTFCTDACRVAEFAQRQRAEAALGRHFARHFPGLAAKAVGSYATARARGVIS